MLVDTDEGVRPGTTPESLGNLRAAFAADGSITAGNASQISDGGAAVVVMSRDEGGELGSTPIAELVSFGMVAGPDPSLLTQPSRAIRQALGKVDLDVGDLDLFELNEAFAAVGLASMRDLGITDEIVNVNGGAIALGHPIGASGTRVVLTLVDELRRRGGGLGAAALCGGGGQGEAAIVARALAAIALPSSARRAGDLGTVLPMSMEPPSRRAAAAPAATAAAPRAGVLVGRTEGQLLVGEAVGYGWDVYWKNVGTLIVIAIVVIAIEIVFAVIANEIGNVAAQIVVQFIGWLVGMLVSLGWLRVSSRSPAA